MSNLGKQSVACKGWRLMPGMRDLGSEFGARIIIAVLADGTQILSAHDTIGVFPEQTTVRSASAFSHPDLDHPATLGCLLALVREAWGQRVTLSPISMGGVWRVGDAYGWACKSQSTEAEALVAALESAP